MKKIKSMKLLKIFHENFSIKVFATFTLFIIIISSSFTCLFILHERKTLTDNLIRKGELIAELLAYNSRIGVFAENKELLKNSAEGFLQYSEVLSLSIFTTEGKQLIEQEKQERKIQGGGIEADQEKLRYIAEKIRRSESPFHLESGADTVEFWAPVLSSSNYFIKEAPFVDDNPFHAKDRIMGFVGVVLDKGMLNKQLHTLLLESILIGIVFLMIGFVATYPIVKRITKPLNKLTENVKAIGKGVAVEKVPVETMDEVGRLALAFNTMVTERKQAEKALLESEKKYRDLVNNALVGVYKTNLRGDVLYVNEALWRMLEFESPEEMMANGVLAIYKNPRERDALLENLRKNNKVENFEVAIVTKTGKSKDVILSAALHDDIISGMIMDITERKQVEEALKLYREIFYHSNDGIGIINPEGFYLEQNPAHRKLTGYSDEELKEKTPAIHLGNETFLKIIEEQTQKGVYRGEIISHGKLGEKKDIDLSAFTITNKNSEVICYVGIKRDITERKRVQEQLQSLSRRLIEVQETERRFLASELHDQVGQNLTALGINLSVIRSQFSGEVDKKIVDRLEDSLKLVEETIERIRHVMAELRPPVLDDYGLGVALHWYTERFSERTGVAIILQEDELLPRPPLVVETAIFRVVQEVLTNVAKHAHARQVTIILERVDGMLQLAISDDGVGFDPTALRQLKEQPGWGLITIEERAKALGGNVYIKSTPGEGTRVIVQLPC